MTEKQIVAREKELQGYLRMHPRLNLEFKAMMSRLLREHRIDVSPETLARMTISLDRAGAAADLEEIPVPSNPGEMITSSETETPPSDHPPTKEGETDTPNKEGNVESSSSSTQKP